MKFVLISDTHGLHDHVQVPPCDILIHAGDCTTDAGRQSLREFLQWFERQPAKYKILIAGNHDWAFEKWPDLARLMVKEVAPSVTYLQDSPYEIEGIKFWGSPVSPRFFDWAFNRDRGADIKRHWDMIPDDVDVLITHGPPYGILDFSGYDDGTDRHVGCKDLLETLKRLKPKLHVHGHIHHSYGALKIENTMHVNPTICNEAYYPVNVPIIWEYSS